MNTAVINVKTNPATKQKAQEVAKQMGVSLSALVNGFLHELVKTKRVTFSAQEEPSEYLLALMKQSEKNLKKMNHSPIFATGEEAVDWLDKQDL